MSTHPDLQDWLDRAIGAAPPAPSMVDPRVLGHRSLLRWRALQAGAAIVAVAVVGTTTLAVTGSEGRRAADTSVAAASPPASDVMRGRVVRTEEGLSNASWATYTSGGVIAMLPDVEIIQRIDNPTHVALPQESVAFELARPGQPRRWCLLQTLDGPWSSGASTTADVNFASLQAWVDFSQANAPDQGYGDLVTLGDDGLVAPAPGVQIIEQRRVEMGGSFARPGGTSAAFVERDGKRFFVLVRRTNGAVDVVATPQTQTRASNLEGFVSDAIATYASGKGLR